MTLFELIKSNAWLSVKFTIGKLFPDQHEFADDYEKMFQQLKEMQPKASDITIDIETIHDTYDDTYYVDVSGYYTNPAKRNDEISNSLAIEFVPWAEWLGMPIDKNSLKNFNELEIIAHCLNEMSYSGFEQEEIQSQFNQIKNIKNEYDNLSPDEKKSRTYTLDEVKLKFGFADSDEVQDKVE